MADGKLEIWLIRHGETAWSLSGQHTGSSEVPLTEKGRAQAEALRPVLADKHFDLVLTSPRQRAQETCRLAGLGDAAQIDPNLAEWDYGEFEGLTTAEIRQTRPGWSVWTGPIVGGETVEQVGARADKVIERVCDVGGTIALFAHAHILRILGARWVGMAPSGGKHLRLDTASISILGYEREAQVIQRWNQLTNGPDNEAD